MTAQLHQAAHDHHHGAAAEQQVHAGYRPAKRHTALMQPGWKIICRRSRGQRPPSRVRTRRPAPPGYSRRPAHVSVRVGGYGQCACIRGDCELTFDRHSGTRCRPIVATNAERRGAQERVSAHHQAQLAELLRHVEAAIDRYRTGEIDANTVDETIHHYHQAAAELWKFCFAPGGGTHAQFNADLLDRMTADAQAIDWWDRTARRRHQWSRPCAAAGAVTDPAAAHDGRAPSRCSDRRPGLPLSPSRPPANEQSVRSGRR
jgi:hypothetical protein